MLIYRWRDSPQRLRRYDLTPVLCPYGTVNTHKVNALFLFLLDLGDPFSIPMSRCLWRSIQGEEKNELRSLGIPRTDRCTF